MTKEIPADRLLLLPEWCVYIETREPDQPGLLGFWACLEADANDGSRELRLVMDTADGVPLCLPLPLLPNATVEDCMADTMEYSAVQAIKRGQALPTAETLEDWKSTGRAAAAQAARLVNLVLYLCADAPDLDREPLRATPRKTKHGPRWFPTEQPRVLEVGVRTARWLREARARAHQAAESGTGAPLVTPHIRRAHWHGFWSGPLDQPEMRRFSLRWLPQIPVGFSSADLDAIVPTVKTVG